MRGENFSVCSLSLSSPDPLSGFSQIKAPVLKVPDLAQEEKKRFQRVCALIRFEELRVFMYRRRSEDVYIVLDINYNEKEI
jgi:hypothetical protein